MQRLDFIAARAFPFQLSKLARQRFIRPRLTIAQLALQRLAHEDEVAVLAEHERDHDPVIRRARATVRTPEAVERATAPARNTGCGPRHIADLAGGDVRRMFQIRCADQTARADRLHHAPDGDAIHRRAVVHGEIMRREFLLRRDRLRDHVARAIHGHDLAGVEISQGDDQIVIGMDAECGAHWPSSGRVLRFQMARFFVPGARFEEAGANFALQLRHNLNKISPASSVSGLPSLPCPPKNSSPISLPVPAG